MDPFVILFMVIAIGAIGLGFWWDAYSAKEKRIAVVARIALIEKKEIVYQKALMGEDKQLALKLGREYYHAVRGGNLTIYDEQALTNDLSTMK